MQHTSLANSVKTVLLIAEPGFAGQMSARLVRGTGAHIVRATDLGDALRAIETEAPTGIISSLPLENDGLPLLLYVAAHHPELPVVVLLEDASDDAAQQAQWFGATAALALSTDLGALTERAAEALGIWPADTDIWDRVAVAARRHLSLVAAPPATRVDDLLAGLFRGLGEVRGLRGTLALDDDGSLLGVLDSSGSLDVARILGPLQGLVRASHAACAEAGLADCETAVIRTGLETFVMSCCTDQSMHMHVVTMVATDGNSPLVELAHKRLRRAFLSTSAVA